MMTFRNTQFSKRDYECTNVVACSIVDAGATVPEGYEPAGEEILFGLTALWIERGVRFWGYL